MEYQVQLNSKLKSVTAEPIRTLLKTDPTGGYLILVVNLDAAPQGVRVLFPGLKIQAKQLLEAPGAANFSADKRTISFMAGPWNVQIVKFDPE